MEVRGRLTERHWALRGLPAAAPHGDEGQSEEEGEREAGVAGAAGRAAAVVIATTAAVVPTTSVVAAVVAVAPAVIAARGWGRRLDRDVDGVGRGGQGVAHLHLEGEHGVLGDLRGTEGRIGGVRIDEGHAGPRG